MCDAGDRREFYVGCWWKILKEPRGRPRQSQKNNSNKLGIKVVGLDVICIATAFYNTLLKERQKG